MMLFKSRMLRKDRAFHCTTHPEKPEFRRFEEILPLRDNL